MLTSREKWSKVKSILRNWSLVLMEPSPQLLHKELLLDRGFLVYITQTYPAMVPYLKGFHLTIEMWRGGRDADGWKSKAEDDGSVVSNGSLATVEDLSLSAANHLLAAANSVYAPEDGLTMPAPWFKDDIAALVKLSKFELPPLRMVRPYWVVHVYYGFGDASGKQFGATVSNNYSCKSTLTQEKGTHRVRFRIGLWSAIEEEESFNYKELCNLVKTIAVKATAGRLRDCEFFLFTDNSTVEGCFYSGTLNSKLLHSLVLSLWLLQLEYGITLHVIHISGKQMIAQGTDRCLRRSLMEGVMAGEDMLTFFDLGRSAVKRHPPLLDWVRTWTGRPSLTPLTPEGWFEEVHGIVG